MRHDLFYGRDIGTDAQRTACSDSENFLQILGKFETIRFAFDLPQIPPIFFTNQ